MQVVTDTDRATAPPNIPVTQGLSKRCGIVRPVLCGGIGAGAVEALKAGGITVVLVDAAGNAEQIVTAFQSGALRPASVGMCQCQH